MAFLPFLAEATSGFKEEASSSSSSSSSYIPLSIISGLGRRRRKFLWFISPLSSLTLASDERISSSPEKFRPSLVSSCSFCAKKVVSPPPLPHPSIFSHRRGRRGIWGRRRRRRLGKVRDSTTKKETCQKNAVVTYLLQEKVTFLTYKTTNPCRISRLAWPGHCSPTPPPPPPLGGELK